jgi:hypothetical protein
MFLTRATFVFYSLITSAACGFLRQQRASGAEREREADEGAPLVSRAAWIKKKPAPVSARVKQTHTQGCSARDWARIYVHVRKTRKQHTLVAHTQSLSPII